MTTPQLLFYAFAALSVVSALAMLLNFRNTVAAAMSLVVTMVSLAGIFVLLNAFFVAAIQIMVYAGAIVVLFLFVVMLLNLRQDDFAPARQGLVKLAATVVVLLGGARLVHLVSSAPAVAAAAAVPAGFGGFRQVGIALYTNYVLLVEMAALLLLAAIVGALILAKRRIDR